MAKRKSRANKELEKLLRVLDIPDITPQEVVNKILGKKRSGK